MKKSKISIGLVSSFIAALAMSACGEKAPTKKDGALVTFKDNNGNEVEVVTDKMYEDYLKTQDGISKFYNAVLEALIRYQYENENFSGNKGDTKLAKTYNQVVSEAKNSVSSAKSTAKETASTNGTKYADEWDAVLEEKGCEDEKDLLNYYIYQLEKEYMEDWYYKVNKDALLERYLDTVVPYHVRHVLVKVADNSSVVKGVITEQEVKNLYNVVSALADENYTFSEVAQKYSEDEGSAKIYGDAGIMSTTTSFVNEFKLGVYAWDGIYNTKFSDAKYDAVRDNLGLGNTDKIKDYSDDPSIKTVVDAYKDAVGTTITEVDMDDFKALFDVADKTKDNNGKEVNDGDSNYYPRNIIWNHKFNFHNAFLIKATAATPESRKTDDGYLAANINGEKLPIVCARSEYGIHFMVIQKSAFDEKASLKDYYSSAVPGTDEWGSWASDKLTYVNAYSTSSQSTYTERANTIKDAVKSFDSTYDYRLYEQLVAEIGTVEFKKPELQEQVEKYIANLRTSNAQSAADSLQDSWTTYIELLEQQEFLRDPVNNRMIPEVCSVWDSDTDNKTGKWAEGGLCYGK